MPAARSRATARATTKLLVVEDHPIVVDGLVKRLESEAQITVTGIAADPEEGLELFDETRPDLVLSDVELSRDTSGIDLVRALVKKDPSAKILMFSAFATAHLAQEAVQAGAAGYVRKTAPLNELIDCLEAVAAGETEVYDRATSTELLREARRSTQRAKTGVWSLTLRQQEILKFMATESTATSQIASSLHISEHTARSHIDRMLTKLGVSRRSDAVTLAWQEGLVGGPEAGTSRRSGLPRATG